VVGVDAGSAVRGLTLDVGVVRLVCDGFLNTEIGRRGDADRARDSVSGFWWDCGGRGGRGRSKNDVGEMFCFASNHAGVADSVTVGV
jgi:hypothetical protein